MTNHGIYTDTVWSAAATFKTAAGAVLAMAGQYECAVINSQTLATVMTLSSSSGTIDTSDAVSEGKLAFLVTPAQHQPAVSPGLYRLHLKRTDGDDLWASEGRLCVGAPGASETYMLFDAATDGSTATAAIIGVKGDTPTAAELDAINGVMSAKTYGCVADGVADDTVPLKAVFDAAIPLGKSVLLEGHYRVTGPIQPYALRAAGSMHIICRGNVKITVDAGAATFRDLLYLEATAANNGSITGGSLEIECSNRCASGITFRHNAGSAGTVTVEQPVTIRNLLNNDTGATYENQGLAIFGKYQNVFVSDVSVSGVSRSSANAATKGISISGFSGRAIVRDCSADNILTGPGTADADGLAVFGETLGGATEIKGGTAEIINFKARDCQGRGIKAQCGDVFIDGDRHYRQMVVSISNSADVDVQLCGRFVRRNSYHEYRLNGAATPLSSTHSPLVLDQKLTNAKSTAQNFDAMVLSEASVPRYCQSNRGASALDAVAEIVGTKAEALGSFAGPVFARGLLEFDASLVEAATGRSTYKVNNCRGLIGAYPICHASYGSTSLTAKLNIEAVGNYNTHSTIRRVFSAISGSSIVAVESFRIADNFGFHSEMPTGWTFNFNNLQAGCTFTVNIATCVATNAPAWGATGFAVVEAFNQWSTPNNLQHIRVTKGNADVANTVFHTQGGATPTWGTIK